MCKVWDATAKSTEGILRGSVYQMGDFDECVTTRAPFSTQYCLATIDAQVQRKKSNKDPISLYHDPYEDVVERLGVSTNYKHVLYINY